MLSWGPSASGICTLCPTHWRLPAGSSSDVLLSFQVGTGGLTTSPGLGVRLRSRVHTQAAGGLTSGLRRMGGTAPESLGLDGPWWLCGPFCVHATSRGARGGNTAVILKTELVASNGSWRSNVRSCRVSAASVQEGKKGPEAWASGHRLPWALEAPAEPQASSWAPPAFRPRVRVRGSHLPFGAGDTSVRVRGPILLSGPPWGLRVGL